MSGVTKHYINTRDTLNRYLIKTMKIYLTPDKLPQEEINEQHKNVLLNKKYKT